MSDDIRQAIEDGRRFVAEAERDERCLDPKEVACLRTLCDFAASHAAPEPAPELVEVVARWLAGQCDRKTLWESRTDEAHDLLAALRQAGAIPGPGQVVVPVERLQTYASWMKTMAVTTRTQRDKRAFQMAANEWNRWAAARGEEG